MRDLRDPQAMGASYMQMRKAGLPIEDAVRMPVYNFKGNETCIEKYGSANDVQPKWMAVQVK